jgi:hypothetical protein
MLRHLLGGEGSGGGGRGDGKSRLLPTLLSPPPALSPSSVPSCWRGGREGGRGGGGRLDYRHSAQPEVKLLPCGTCFLEIDNLYRML